MKKRNKLFLGAILALSLFTAACSRNDKSVTAVGSTALQPLVEEVGYNYQTQTGTTINVQGGGSGTGLSQVSEGAVQIGDSDLFADQKDGIDASKLEDHKVAVVGIAVVANQDIGVKNLSTSQLRDIFAGKITNWKQVGGKDQKIVLIHRSQGSGTRFTFEAKIMGKTKVAAGQEQDSNGSVQKIVASTPGAISYLAFAYAQKKDLLKLEIDHVKPTSTNVTTNRWKIWSYEHMYVNKKHKTKATEAFLRYIESKKVQQTAIKELGYISMHDMKVKQNSKGQVTAK